MLVPHATPIADSPNARGSGRDPASSSSRPAAPSTPPLPPPDRPDRPLAPSFSALRRPGNFQAAFRRGRRSRQPLLSMVARRNDLDPASGASRRVGFAISRRVGGAVVRNRVRRRLRALLRALTIEAGTDLVITAHPAAATATFQALGRDLEACAAACGVLALDRGDPGDPAVPNDPNDPRDPGTPRDAR